jgi:excisionase family DNA binding protein
VVDKDRTGDNQMQKPDEFFTLRGVSEGYFNGTVSLETVRDWVHAGRLPHVRPGRIILVRRRDLDDLVNKSAGVRLTVPWLHKEKSEAVNVS